MKDDIARLHEAHRLLQESEAIGTLSAGIAHDFNNLLTTILGYSGMALDDIPEGNSARLKIEEVLNAGNRTVVYG